MKSPKRHFADLKSVVLILALVGLVLISGFISSKTLLPETSTEPPLQTNVNASFGGSTVNVSTSDSGVKANSNQTGVPANSGDPGVGPARPISSSGNPDVTVWVNTKSGVYHCPNTRWYGNTKNGEYMTQTEAQAKGHRPAYGSVCG